MLSQPAPAPSAFDPLRWFINQPYVLLTLTSLFWAGNIVLARHVAGHVPQPGIRRKTSGRLGEGVVDVAAGAVGEDAHERRIEPVGTQQLLEGIGERPEMVGADVLRGNLAHVVHGLLRQHGDRAAVASAIRALQERGERVEPGAVFAIAHKHIEYAGQVLGEVSAAQPTLQPQREAKVLHEAFARHEFSRKARQLSRIPQDIPLMPAHLTMKIDPWNTRKEAGTGTNDFTTLALVVIEDRNNKWDDF